MRPWERPALDCIQRTQAIRAAIRDLASRELEVNEHPLSNAFDDPRTIAAIASTLLARHLVYQLAGFRFGSTWRSGFRIIIRVVLPKWI